MAFIPHWHTSTFIIIIILPTSQFPGTLAHPSSVDKYEVEKIGLQEKKSKVPKMYAYTRVIY
jgi:hypothetical protein